MVGPSYSDRLLRSMLAGVIATALATTPGCGATAATPRPKVAPSTLRWISLAEDQEKTRKYHQARLLYLRARREAPDDFSRGHASRKLGLALMFWGEYAAAGEALSEAVALRPDDVASWHDLGMVRHKLGDPRGAVAAFRRSIELRPRDPRSRIALAALLWNDGDFPAAIEEYRALLRLELPAAIGKKVKWAIGALQQAMSQKPNGPPVP